MRLSSLLLLCLIWLPVSAGWYDAGWTYRQKITIDNTEVDADLTDFPIYLDTDDLTADFYTHANGDCAEVRITKTDGVTEVPREVVFCDGTNGEIHFKASGTLSSSADTDFYIYYGNGDATDYATSATYGAENVWNTNYEGVWHLQEDPSSGASAMIDSTSNSNDLDANNMESGDSTTGILSGKGLLFDGTNEDLDRTTVTGLPTGSTDRTYSVWLNTTSTSTRQQLISMQTGTTIGTWYEQEFGFNASKPLINTYNAYKEGNTATMSASTDIYYVSTLVGTTVADLNIYIDGVAVSTGTVAPTTTLNTTSSNFRIASRGSSSLFYTGVLDEIRASSTGRASTWISTEYNNQNSPSTFYTASAEETFTTAWYDSAWLYRQKITVEASQVNGDLTDFPVYVDTDDFNSGFYTNANGDCADVRVTKFDGTTEVPREIVFCDGTNGEFHFKATGTLSASSDTDYYIYYGNAAASDYATSATYGAENVWSAFDAIYHMQEDPSGSAPQMIDSTGNGYDGTSAGTMTTGDLITGQLGKALDFDGTNDSIGIGTTPHFSNTTAFTLSCWASPTATYNMLIAKGTNSVPYEGVAFFTQSGRIKLSLVPSTGVGGQITRAGTLTTSGSGSLHHFVGTYAGDNAASSLHVYTDGANDDASAFGTWSGSQVTTRQLKIGERDGGLRTNGEIDEVRITVGSVLTSTWISTEYNNQSSPSTFYTMSAEETEGVAPAAAVDLFGGFVF